MAGEEHFSFNPLGIRNSSGFPPILIELENGLQILKMLKFEIVFLKDL